MKKSCQSSRARARRTVLTIVMAAALPACREVSSADAATGPRWPQARRIEELWGAVGSTVLDLPADSNGFAVGAWVDRQNVLLLDMERAELRSFSLATGKPMAMVSGPGSGAGKLRSPEDLVPLGDGTFAIYDSRRNRVSFRNGDGTVREEVRVPAGYFGGFTVLADSRHIVFTGVLTSPADAVGKDIHEFDFSGKYLRSYGEAQKERSDWKRRFAAVLVASTPSQIVTGVMNGSRVRVLDRATLETRWVEIAPGWQSLDWPADQRLKGADRSAVSGIITKWTRTQRLMNGIFVLSGNRFLARYRGFGTGNDEIYYYVVADSAGRAQSVTLPSRKRIVRVQADTAYWVSAAPGAKQQFGRAVLH